MSRAAAVLWDMDGVLVDSEPVWTVAETELYASWGRVWGPEVKAACVGKRLEAAVPIMIAFAGLDDGVVADPAEVSAWLLARMRELFAERLRWRAGARELLDAVAARGVPQALVSSSYRVLVDAALLHVPPGRFAFSLAGDEVVHGKPHPEPYLTAATRLGVDPRRCVVIEDTLTGVASAEAAGCTCVVAPEITRVEPTPARPVVGDLREIDPDWLLSLPAAVAEA